MITKKRTYKQTLELSDFDLGWLVGMIEGEGNIFGKIGQEKYGGYLGVGISVSSTDKDMIDKLYEIVPYGTTSYKRLPKLPHHKTQYVWNVTKRQEVRTIAETLLPYLSIRRQEQFQKTIDLINEYEI